MTAPQKQSDDYDAREAISLLAFRTDAERLDQRKAAADQLIDAVAVAMKVCALVHETGRDPNTGHRYVRFDGVSAWSEGGEVLLRRGADAVAIVRLDFDRARGILVGKDPDEALVPVPGELRAQRRSAVAVVVAAMLAEHAKET